MKTKVIFRKCSDGEVIALFPAEAFSNHNLGTCSAYVHNGQHTEASVFLTRSTKHASRKEFAPLARELRRIGYKLRVVARFHPSDRAARLAQMKS